jgi:DNA-binding transcriptional ArsR family regulator
MTTGTRIAELGALLGDPTRAGLLNLMMDGRASTVGELARASHVALSTASEHLSRLHSAGLVEVQPQGRHRYYRLAGPEIAGLLETIGSLPLRRPGGDPAAAARGPVPASHTPQELRFARTCYDHLAGSLAVALHGLLVIDHDGHPELAPEAPAALRQLGLDSEQAAAPASRRPKLRNCLDWSERRPHLAGATGAALLTLLLDRGWVVRRHTPRAVRLTNAGQEALTAAFGPHPCWPAPTPAPSMRS